MIGLFALCGSLFTAAADAKAAQITEAMTTVERMVLVRGESGDPIHDGVHTGAIGSAGYVAGIPRLGVPALQESDASLGIANPNNVRHGDVATASVVVNSIPVILDAPAGLRTARDLPIGFFSPNARP